MDSSFQLTIAYDMLYYVKFTAFLFVFPFYQGFPVPSDENVFQILILH